jgi:LPXTG-site transpeptidase (sortase) family protein
LVINWNDVSWIFNYKEVSGLVSDFFNPYPSIDQRAMDAYFYPNHSQDTSTQVAGAQTAVPQAVKNVKTLYTDNQNTLEVPKISISVPIIFSTSAEKSAIMKDLDAGVVYYPGSVYPGQVGQIIVLGHSAPVGWPKIKHDWVFSDLNKLEVGDMIYIDVNNQKFTYVVKKKTIINRGAEVPTDSASLSNNVLTLISCWPPGKDYQRIAVTAELQNS